MVTVHDLTVAGKFPVGKISSFVNQLGSKEIRHKATILGSDLKKVGAVVGDSFKIFNLGRKCRVVSSAITVIKADDTAITIDLGYTDGTNLDADAFDGSVAINATGVTEAVDNKKFLDNATGANFYTYFTPSALSTLDDATEILIEQVVAKYNDCAISTSLSAPV